MKSDISLKRALASLLLPYRPFLDRTNWMARWCDTVKQTDCPMFQSREEMYSHLQRDVLRDEAIDYLEFGVADGSSLRSWCATNRHPKSRFFGFDCFTGLPEHWSAKRPKGTFSQGGVPPEIGDARVQFQVGLFQDSLPGFLESYRPVNRMVIHNDSDLYSSTLYTLTMLDKIMPRDTVVIFDEFWDVLHEYRALFDYASAYRRSYQIVSATPRFAEVAVILSGTGVAVPAAGSSLVACG